MNAWQKYNLPVDDWDNLVALKFKEYSHLGKVYCDVGACVGIYTNFFKGLAGDSGMVYSFEMNPNNYNNLTYLNSVNCIVENLAVSDKDGDVDIFSDSNNPGNHVSNIIGYNTAFEKMPSIGKIKSVNLDTYFKDKVVDFIKIDVEGAELQVIQGGINTLKKCKMAIIECHFDEDWKQIVDLLNENGLNFKYIVNDEDIFYGSTTKIPGRSEIGRGYQIYMVNTVDDELPKVDNYIL